MQVGHRRRRGRSIVYRKGLREGRGGKGKFRVCMGKGTEG